MFKALFAASLAMLACCVAAAWAGPVGPTSSDDRADAVVVEADEIRPGVPELAVTTQANDDGFSLLNSVVVEGFVPVSLSATYEGGSPLQAAPAENVAPLSAQAQPAVIPLPRPLYAAAVLLVLAIVARRLIARTCHA